MDQKNTDAARSGAELQIRLYGETLDALDDWEARLERLAGRPWVGRLQVCIELDKPRR